MWFENGRRATTRRAAEVGSSTALLSPLLSTPGRYAKIHVEFGREVHVEFQAIDTPRGEVFGDVNIFKMI